jgi:Tfp pilus assembly pilus retraction ATPase PilT
MNGDYLVETKEDQDVYIHDLLEHVLAEDASDLHITVGAPPTIRVHGDLRPLAQYPHLNPNQLREMINSILTQRQRERLEQDLELDLSYSRPCHIMTVEDPIEYLHRHKRAIVNQRELGADTHSFASALKHVLRQDPDVILVGEMRDLETIGTAITAAETGHLVFATLHTQDAPQTIDRIIDAFPPFQQQQIRVQLSTTLQGVVTQQLVPTWDGLGRVVSAEVMVTTPAVRNLIREAKVHQIYSAMQAGARYGMRTMDQALAHLVTSGKISIEIAQQRCHDRNELDRLTGRAQQQGAWNA